MNSHVFFQTSEAFHPKAQRHIDEDSNVEQYRRKHLGSRVELFMLQ